MADFWRVLARWLNDASPDLEAQETHADKLWGAHMHSTGRHKLEKLVDEGTASWLPEEVKKATAAWNEVNASQHAYDINEEQNNELIQSAAEAASSLGRRRDLARMKAKKNPRSNPEEY